MKKIPFILFLIAALPIWCKGSDQDTMNEVTAILLEIENEMVKKLPDHAKGLGAPATPESIRMLGDALPAANESLLSLYRWHNGGAGNYFELIPGGHFCSIERALELRRANSEIRFLDKSVRTGLPLIYNLSGDMFFASVTPETVRVFKYTVGEKPKPVGTLLNFLHFTLSFWRSEGVEMENELFLAPTARYYDDLDSLIEKAGD